jgi:predicted nucleic acid-binding protein
LIERCVDANIAVKWIISDEPLCNEANAFLDYAEKNGIILIAPTIFIGEVDSVIRKHVFYGKMSINDAHRAYISLDQIPVKIFEIISIRQSARDIAERFNQKAVYDSTYAALAELRGCEFWTADKVFYNAVKSDLKYVRYLLDYL